VTIFFLDQREDGEESRRVYPSRGRAMRVKGAGDDQRGASTLVRSEG